MVFDGSSSMRSFAAKTPDNFPKHFVCLTVIEMQCMSVILPKLVLDFFNVGAAGFRASACRFFFFII